MTKNKKLRDIVVSVTLPIAAMLLRLIYHYYSLSNILENIKSSPASEALPILAQTAAAVCILLTLVLENKTGTFLLCIAVAAASVALSPFLSLALAPVIFGFFAVRFKAYKTENIADKTAVAFAVLICGVSCIILFPAKAFNYDSQLGDIAQQFSAEISVPFTAATVLLTLGGIIFTLLSKKKKPVFACLMCAEAAAFIFSIVFFNQVTDKELVICAGYIILFIYAVYAAKVQKD